MTVRVRIAAFVSVSIGLIVLAVVLAPTGSPPAPPAPGAVPAMGAMTGSNQIATASRRKARLDQAARSFIAAFLRYGVGDLPASVAGSIRRGTTAGFGRYLLDARPRPLGPIGAARIVEVEVTFLDPAADRALVRALARRPDGPEELSFVFVLRGGRWLAAAAAE